MNKIGVRSDREILWSIWHLETIVAAAGACRWTFERGLPFGNLEHELIIASGLFDAKYFLGKKNPSATEQRQALRDYTNSSAHASRAPSIFFDGSAYLQAYPDVREAGINPLVHFIRHGMLEDRLAGVGTTPPKHAHQMQAPLSPLRLPFWRRLPGLGWAASSALKDLISLIEKARTKLLVQLPGIEDLNIDLYVARSDFQRALLHNERLMRDLTALRECISTAEAKEMVAEIEKLVVEVATLREDAREADREMARWRARAEAAERQLAR